MYKRQSENIRLKKDSSKISLGTDANIVSLTHNISGLRLDTNKKLEFGDSGEYISGDNTDLTIASGNDINIIAEGQILNNAKNATGHIFAINSTNQLSIIDGMIKPTTDNDIDLGSSSNSFKNAHIQGTSTIGTINSGKIETNSTLDIDSAGTLQINSSGSTINIGNDDIDQAINIGTQGERTINIATGAFADTINMGNATGSTAVNILQVPVD